jgi:YfiH family protein
MCPESEILGRAVSPVVDSGSGRTRLSYPDISDPRIAHGILVFKEAVFGSDHDTWLGLVRPELERHLHPGPRRIAVPHQVHSARVVRIDREAHESIECDGFVTSTPLTAIGISVADCVPLFAFDLERGVAGLAHCGWRGLASGVVEELLAALGRDGGGTDGLSFLIGAAIGPCCYRVGDDLLACFKPEEVRDFSTSTGGEVFFDIKRVVASRLVAGGARPEKISIDNTCTSCKKYLLSSFRADGRGCGRMLAYLMLTG